MENHLDQLSNSIAIINLVTEEDNEFDITVPIREPRAQHRKAKIVTAKTAYIFLECAMK